MLLSSDDCVNVDKLKNERSRRLIPTECMAKIFSIIGKMGR